MSTSGSSLLQQKLPLTSAAYLLNGDISGIAWAARNGEELDVKLTGVVACWQRNLSRSIEETGARVEHLAERVGTGYKAANLIHLRGFVHGIEHSLEVCSIDVPDLLPIYHLEIVRYLKRIGVDIQAEWQKFVRFWRPSERRSYLKGTTSLSLKRRHLAWIERIERSVRESMDTKPFTSVVLTDWLAEREDQPLIVRSTGREDSSQLMNADAHESVAGVRASAAAISEAMSIVLSSYFSEKSIRQRIALRDQSIVDSKSLLIPILIQEMVPDRGVWGAPQRAGVLFYGRPGLPPDSCQIEAALGSNAGVVQGSVAVDTYLLDEAMRIHCTVRPQSHTLHVGVNKEKPNKIELKNPRTHQVLPDVVLRDLYRVGAALSKKQDGPVDIEFAVLDGGKRKPHIKLLQARPLLREDPADETTVFSESTVPSTSESRTVRGEVITTGKGRVFPVAADEILIEPRLAVAHSSYLSRTPVPKLVICHFQCPQTSHAALFFLNMGVAVIRLSDPSQQQTLSKLMRNQDKLWVSPLQGIIVTTPPSSPAPETFAAPSTSLVSNALSVRPYRAIQARDLRALLCCLDGLLPEAPGLRGSIDFLLDIMKTSTDSVEAKSALDSLLYYLRRNLVRMQTAGTVQDSPGLLRQLFMVVLRIAEHAQGAVRASLEHATCDPRRQFNVQILERLLFQEGREDVVNAISLKTAMQDIITADRVNESFGSEKFVVSLLLSCAFPASRRSRWLDWIYDQKSGDRQSTAVRDMLALHRMGILPIVLNIADSLAISSHTLDEIYKEVLAAERDQNHWARGVPSNALQVGFHDRCTRAGRFVSRNRDVPVGQRIAVWGLIERLVRALDESIKALKANTEVTLSSRIIFFGKMLKSFHDLMENMVATIPADAIAKPAYYHTKDAQEQWKDPKQHYLDRLLDGGSYKYGLPDESFGDDHDVFQHDGLGEIVSDPGKRNERQLLISEEFNVSSLLVFSKADLNFSAHWPDTLEEYFTLAHQNMMRIIGYHYARELKAERIFDGQAKELFSAIQGQDAWSLGSVQFLGGRVHIGVTVPLRQHSALLKYSFDPRSPEEGLEMELEAYGNDEHRRWDKIAGWLPQYVAQTAGLNLLETPEIDYRKPTGVKVRFHANQAFFNWRSLVSTLDILTRWLTMEPRRNASIAQKLGVSDPRGDIEHSPYLLGYFMKMSYIDDVRVRVRAAVAAIDYVLSTGRDYRRGKGVQVNGSRTFSMRAHALHVLERDKCAPEVLERLWQTAKAKKESELAAKLERILRVNDPLWSRARKHLAAGQIRELILCEELSRITPQLNEVSADTLLSLPLLEVGRKALIDGKDFVLLAVARHREDPRIRTLYGDLELIQDYLVTQRSRKKAFNEVWSDAQAGAVNAFVALGNGRSYKWKSMDTNLEGYDRYLGTAKYEYAIVENYWDTTSKIHKAASIGCLIAMESGSSHVLREMLKYYLLLGFKQRRAAGLRDTLNRLLVHAKRYHKKIWDELESLRKQYESSES